MVEKKILITGIVASGKSTMARQLSQKSGIPLYELDTIAHPKHKSHYGRPHDEQKRILEEIDKSDQWIMEGTDRKNQRYKPSIKMLRMMYKWTADFEEEREEFEAFLRQYSKKVQYLKQTILSKEMNKIYI